MKRSRTEKIDIFVSLTRHKPIQFLIIFGLLYILLVTLEIPFVFKSGLSAVSQEFMIRPPRLESEEDFEERDAPTRPPEIISQNSDQPIQRQLNEHNIMSGLIFDSGTFHLSGRIGSSELYESAKNAWEAGKKTWEELEMMNLGPITEKPENQSESCPLSISLSGSEFLARGQVMVLPCGLTLGSHITVVGTPLAPRLYANRVLTSQIIMELQGLMTVEGEEPPKILHFNPRLKGDWSGKPVIEQNTCYRMHWDTAQRCDGSKSNDDEETGK